MSMNDTLIKISNPIINYYTMKLIIWGKIQRNEKRTFLRYSTRSDAYAAHLNFSKPLHCEVVYFLSHILHFNILDLFCTYKKSATLSHFFLIDFTAYFPLYEVETNTL